MPGLEAQIRTAHRLALPPRPENWIGNYAAPRRCRVRATRCRLFGAASEVNSTMTRCRRTLTERCRGEEELDNGRQYRPPSSKDVPTKQ